MIRKTYSVILLLSLLLSVFAYGITEEISIPLEHPVDELGIALDDIGPAVSDESGIVLNDDPIEITSDISLGMSDQSEANATKGIPATLTLGVKEKATLKVSGKVRYKSSKAAVATVSTKGVITAKRKGKAIITVTSGKKELGRCTVKVVAAPKSVTLTPKSASIEIGQTFQLTSTLPKNTHSSLSYSSTNSKVATVTNSGLVRGLSAGKADITVKAYNGVWSKCAVTVTDPTAGIDPTEEKVRLVYADMDLLYDGTIIGETAKAFKEKVEALSNGTVTVELYGGGIFGTEEDILNGVLGRNNTVDIIRCSATALAQYGCDKASLLVLPYTFESDAHFWKFASSNLAKKILSQPQTLGLPLRGICFGMEGFRHFFFSNPVSGINDLKGLKIRVAQNPIMTGMVNDLGATAAACSYAELYPALHSVVNGAELSTFNYMSNSFYEVAPHLLLDGHTVNNAFQIIITDNAWTKLSKKQQEVIMTAGKYASNVCKRKQTTFEKDALAQLKKKGVTIVKVSDKSAWRKACKRTISANMTDKALYNKILALAKG